MKVIFDEVYSSYFNAVAEIIGFAVRKELTREKLYDIVREKGFAESTLTIPQNLTDGTWPLLRPDLTTPLKNIPSMPLTDLQKRWLKTLFSDPRIRLFDVTDEGLEDVKPLYSEDIFVYYDRYNDGDHYADPMYIGCFRTVLTALKERKKLQIVFTGQLNRQRCLLCTPRRLEYSSKDDKFRLITTSNSKTVTVNLARIKSCTMLCSPADLHEAKAPVKKTVVLELKDERNALERIMLHFSHFDKEAERLTEYTYRLTIHYEQEDETELIIRVLSFGPMVRAVSPDNFIEKIRERIKKQEKLRTEI